MNVNLIIKKLFVLTFFSFYLFGQENYAQKIHGTKEMLNFILPVCSTTNIAFVSG